MRLVRVGNEFRSHQGGPTLIHLPIDLVRADSLRLNSIIAFIRYSINLRFAQNLIMGRHLIFEFSSIQQCQNSLGKQLIFEPDSIGGDILHFDACFFEVESFGHG